MDEKINTGFDRVDDTFVDIKENHLKPIDTKVAATNGRVKKLELWRSFILGELLIINVIFFLFVPTLIGKLIDHYVK